MLLTLLRHGETTGRPFVFRGRSDPPLSAHGWMQLERAASLFEKPPIERLVASPSRRCSEFARTWAQQHEVAVTLLDALREIDFGEWEELTCEEACARDAECYAQLQRDPHGWCSPGGEPYVEFRRRVLDATAQLYCNGGPHLGVVTHAGVIRIVLGELLNLQPADAHRIVLPPASACRLWCESERRGCLLALHGEPG